MKTKSTFATLATGALLFGACGGGTTSSTTSGDEYADAAPTSETMALDMDTSDTVDTQALGANDCHPHLFQRTREAIKMLNHHVLKVFARLDRFVDKRPDATTTNSHTWVRTTNNLTYKAVLTKSGDQFTLEFDVKAATAADTSFVQFASGTFTRIAGQTHAGNGTINLDLTALGTVVTNEKAKGQIAEIFEVNSLKKKIQITLTNFVPDSDKSAAPRNGNYVFARTKGAGGSFKFEKTMDLLCPANPTHQLATVQIVARWAASANGRIGRTDALATGGQITAGNKFIGVTCSSIDKADASAEGYWMMKLEDSAGATVHGSDAADTSGAAACDVSLFGPVPSVSSNSSDYDFSAVNFTDASVVAYPGQ